MYTVVLLYDSCKIDRYSKIILLKFGFLSWDCINTCLQCKGNVVFD